MSTPTDRKSFGKWCLRNLGHPVIEINVSDEQIDDRIDEALSWYYDFHMDGTNKQYWRAQLAANNFGGRVHSLKIDDGGTLYSNSDTIVFTSNNGVGSGAAATLTTNANGIITSATLSANSNGSGYSLDPSVSVTTSTGSGAVIKPVMGGFVQLPDNIIGTVQLYPMNSTYSSASMFNIRYQMALNDLYTLTNINLVPYYMARQHISLIEEILIGQPPIRYNRHENKLYIDGTWSVVNEGDWIIVEAYSVIDPVQYPRLWSDKWLQQYTTALIKRNWGSNLKKFQGMPMPGGMMFSGQQIYNEADAEVKLLKDELVNTYSIPAAGMFIG